MCSAYAPNPEASAEAYQNPWQETLLRQAECVNSSSQRKLMLLKVSEQSIVQIFERCHELEVVDLVPSRWTAAQDLLLWHLV